eukprot:11183859-Lingulodinium_polyedra.AAC.1
MDSAHFVRCARCLMRGQRTPKGKHTGCDVRAMSFQHARNVVIEAERAVGVRYAYCNGTKFYARGVRHHQPRCKREACKPTIV